MKSMDEAEIRSFMGTGSKTGKLAVVRSDGRPHVSPVWFCFDPDTGDLVFMTWHTSVKAKSLRRNPQVSVLVDDETFPFAWARVDGIASLSDDDVGKVHWATETSRRYVGDERAEEFGIRNGVAGELVVRVRPTHLTGQTDLAS